MEGEVQLTAAIFAIEETSRNDSNCFPAFVNTVHHIVSEGHTSNKIPEVNTTLQTMFILQSWQQCFLYPVFVSCAEYDKCIELKFCN